MNLDTTPTESEKLCIDFVKAAMLDKEDEFIM